MTMNQTGIFVISFANTSNRYANLSIAVTLLWAFHDTQSNTFLFCDTKEKLDLIINCINVFRC